MTDQPSKKVQDELKTAGFIPTRTVGSHTWWKHPNGSQVSLPDGHRKISPGVYRQVLNSIKESEK